MSEICLIRAGGSDTEFTFTSFSEIGRNELRAEQKQLEQERKQLEKILSSDKNLNKLIKKEIEQDAKTYAVPRLSKIVEREEAKATPI